MRTPPELDEPVATRPWQRRRSELRVAVQVAGAVIVVATLVLSTVGFSHFFAQPELVVADFVWATLPDVVGMRTVIAVTLLVPTVAFTAAGLVLLWYGRDAWMPLLVGVMLVTLGATLSGSLRVPHELYPATRPVVDAIWVLTLALVTVTLYAFPDGRFEPRWTRWAALAAVVIVPVVAGPPLLMDVPYRTAMEVIVRLPADGLGALPAWRWAVIVGTMTALWLPGLAVQVQRYRRTSEPGRRRQTRWVTATLGLFLLIVVGGVLAPSVVTDLPAPYVVWVHLGSIVALTLFALTIVNAVLRHRLYASDVVLNRTVVFGLLAAFITVVYVGIVVGLGYVLGGIGQPGTTLSVLATAVVAVAFQPVRQRVQRLANRLVYGERATPYEVMADFGRSMAASLSLEEVLPRMAQAAATGVGAELAKVSVWLPSGGSGSARWPESGQAATPEPEWDGRATVTHEGALVGEIAVVKPSGGRLTSGEERLLEALADQAGLALHNVGLAAELRARLGEIAAQAAELRASRQRIVAAQAAEQRRMERKIHDGAQQQLVAMSVKLGLVERLVDQDPRQAAAALADLGLEANTALEELRDLARGIFPPLLADQGLVSALEAGLRKHPGPVELAIGDGVVGARFDEQAEIAAYFCCREALDNAASHAPGSPVTLRVGFDDGHIAVTVADEGPGFHPAAVGFGDDLQSMADRVEALGGALHVDSEPNRGTTVTARIPAQVPEPDRGDVDPGDERENGQSAEDQAEEPAAQASARVSGPNADLGM